MKRLTAILLALCLLFCGCAPAPTSGHIVAPVQEQLWVHFIDVGQADSILLEHNGQFALIDGGSTSDGDTVSAYLHMQGVTKLDLLVATHAHSDHVGGLSQVLDAYPADTIWASPMTVNSNAVRTFLKSVKNQGKELEQPKVGQVFELGKVMITVLGPVKEYEELNNQSLVLMVEYGDTRFLLTGDMEREAETDLVESGVNLKADVLKVGHHGSDTSTTYRFLREVMPAYGIISCGKDNAYGFPHEDPLSRLRDAEVSVFRTDENASIVVRSNGKDLVFAWGDDLSLINAA